MPANPALRGARLIIPNKDKPTQRNNLDQIERWANTQVVNQVVPGDGVTITTQAVGTGPGSSGNEGTGIITISASGGSGGYASLTGPGETTTPGDLTQAGGFTVNAPSADSIDLNADGANQFIHMNAGSSLTIESGGVTLTIDSFGGALTIESGGGKIEINGQSGEIQLITTGAAIDVQTDASTITLNSGGGGTTGGGDIDIISAGGGINLFSYAGGIEITGEAVNITGNASGAPVNICAAPARLLGFFGVSAVAQQTTPTTLAQVISLLQAYGLSA